MPKKNLLLMMGLQIKLQSLIKDHVSHFIF